VIVIDPERSAQAAWLRWLGIARCMTTATRRGITDPVERYRHLAIHYHGLRGDRLDGFMRFAEAAVRDGRWRDLEDPILPEVVVGRMGAELMRRYDLYPVEAANRVAGPVRAADGGATGTGADALANARDGDHEAVRP
jgi:hypothetical protein